MRYKVVQRTRNENEKNTAERKSMRARATPLVTYASKDLPHSLQVIPEEGRGPVMCLVK